MDKKIAIAALGGTDANAARAMGICLQAIRKWPATLTPGISDKVIGCLARKRLTPKALAQLLSPL